MKISCTVAKNENHRCNRTLDRQAAYEHVKTPMRTHRDTGPQTHDRSITIIDPHVHRRYLPVTWNSPIVDGLDSDEDDEDDDGCSAAAAAAAAISSCKKERVTSTAEGWKQRCEGRKTARPRRCSGAARTARAGNHGGTTDDPAAAHTRRRRSVIILLLLLTTAAKRSRNVDRRAASDALGEIWRTLRHAREKTTGSNKLAGRRPRVRGSESRCFVNGALRADGAGNVNCRGRGMTPF